MTSPLFNEIYAVGDSLSDSGGIFGLSRQALLLAAAAGVDTQGLQPIPVSPPYAGKFSNGPVLPEITADLLGADLHNFAFGGAQALGTQTLLDAAGTAIPGSVLAAIEALPPAVKAPIEAVLDHNINLPGQVADFVAATSAHAPADNSALVSMIGLNDLRGLAASFDPNDPLALLGVLQLAGGIVQADLALAHTAFDHGIDTVIFETLPAASFFPIGQQLAPALQTIADAAVDSVNVGLQAGALALQLQGLDVRVVDLARMAHEISVDPGTFGFANLQQPTLLGNGIQFSVNPSAPPIQETAFFDPVHATTNLHGVLAAFAAASLTMHTDFRGDGNDFINGTAGDDLVLAGGGNDQAFLGDGNDILLGGLGVDFVDGGAGSDLIAGGAGNDQLWGNFGADVLAGNAGDDTLHGGPGNDALIGGLGNDTLFGDDGDDQFFDDAAVVASLAAASGTDRLAALAGLFRAFGGTDVDPAGAGNDFVDGGDGVDTAHYSGPSSHYKLVASPTTITVQDRFGVDGVDTLVSVERTEFTDLRLDTTWFTKAASVPAGQLTDLTDLYIAYFDRAPDALGLFYWASRLNDGMTLPQISQSFFVQPETVAAYPVNQTTTEFVTEVYGNVLGRAPDLPGLAYWVNSLDTGGIAKDAFVLAVIYGARAGGSQADVQYLANRDAVGKAFAVTEGLSDVAAATTVMAHVDGTAASVQTALHAIDGFAAAAASPNSPELVVQLIGVTV
jgi:Ca2+-binding RTX toxin-like protein